MLIVKIIICTSLDEEIHIYREMAQTLYLPHQSEIFKKIRHSDENISLMVSY